jgi:hypothetical protein
MSDENQGNKLAEKNKEQQGGWFSSPQPQTSSTSGREPHGFFDRPPVLFTALIWFFPYSYLLAFAIALKGISIVFQAFHLSASDIIPFDYIKALILPMPLLFVVCMLRKGSWFLRRIVFLVLFWLVLILTMGITQGALTSALSKVYSSGQ